MGGAVSTGINNDDLIDNLLEADYIRTLLVEHVFRAVDRGHYFLPEARGNAYKDLAWKSGHLHMSAPCIYTEVMEGLCLEQGLSFLNLGSGTGYLSTLAGLILGSSGVNHGIEIHEDVVQYAYRRLEEFRKFSGAIDEFDFCEPKFVVGNCLCLTSELKYDRIYCGAGCPPHYENYMKSLLKVNGILVMPLNEQLIQVKCITETDYEVNTLLPVSFATLIVPDHKIEIYDLLSFEPMTLQNLCRANIRNILRKNITKENPDEIKRPRHKKIKRRERVLKHLTVPPFDTDGSSDEEQVTFGHNNMMGRGIVMIHEDSDNDNEMMDNPAELNNPNPKREFGASVRFAVQDEIQAMMSLYSDAQARNPFPREENDESKNEDCNMEGEISEAVSNNEEMPSTSSKVASNNRIKFDSGFGDEIEENVHNNESVYIYDSSTSEDESDSVPTKRAKGKRVINVQTGAKWKRANLPTSHHSSESDSENIYDAEDSPNLSNGIMVSSPYTTLMTKRIHELPLPNILKNYLNYYKEF